MTQEQLVTRKTTRKRDEMKEETTTRPRETKRICYLAPDVPVPSPRGSSVHVTEVARNLSLLGYEVHVICRRLSKSEPKSESLNGLTIHRINRYIVKAGSHGEGSAGRSAAETRRGLIGSLYYLYLRTVFCLYASFVALKIIRRYRLGEILERETSFGAGGLASLFARKPMILEIVGPRYSRLSVQRSKRILYYTDSMLRKWVDRRKCIEVSAGVDLNLFREDLALREKYRKKLGYEPQHKVLGYVGTFQDWHGIDTLLSSLREISNSHPEVRALFVGPYYEKYEALANNFGLSNVCTFTGPIDYDLVVGYINACDVMLALYEPERNDLRRKYGIGSPIKILEYMACAQPVVSTRVKPIDKVIQNGETGYLVQPSDQGSLVSQITSILGDESRAKLIAERGMEMVTKKYSWRTLANTISDALSSTALLDDSHHKGKTAD